ncbi:MAG: hypothetical protein F6K03_16215, partial [Kamptonema sp. SIO4C4]|nr:hypothetical protein [Kamptonema sp. SIO4C4]
AAWFLKPRWDGEMSQGEPLPSFMEILVEPRGSTASAVQTAACLSANTDDSKFGPLKMFDGEAMIGLMNLPKHLREAIEAETEVYTMEKPPTFFGSGAVAR